MGVAWWINAGNGVNFLSKEGGGVAGLVNITSDHSSVRPHHSRSRKACGPVTDEGKLVQNPEVPIEFPV